MYRKLNLHTYLERNMNMQGDLAIRAFVYVIKDLK